MDLIEKIKSIEKYVCEYFEDLDLDDPVEEGYFTEYEEVRGATDKEIHDFESHFNIMLPKDLKDVYTYRNGSRFFPLLPALIDNRDYSFTGSIGQAGQILCYVHDPDEVLYVCPDITSLIDDIRENIITTS